MWQQIGTRAQWCGLIFIEPLCYVSFSIMLNAGGANVCKAVTLFQELQPSGEMDSKKIISMDVIICFGRG